MTKSDVRIEADMNSHLHYSYKRTAWGSIRSVEI